MSARERIPEIALGVSTLTFSLGATANVLSSHVNVDHEQVRELEDQEDTLNLRLNKNFPQLEALYQDDKISVEAAKNLGASPEWYDLHSQLKVTDTKLARARHGNDLLHDAGFTATAVGFIGVVGSFMVLSADVEKRKRDIEWQRHREHQDLAYEADLSGRVFGLEKYADSIPALALEPYQLAPLFYEEPEVGLTSFVKYEPNKHIASEVFKKLSGAKEGSEQDIEVIEMVAPLFNTEFTVVAGGYDGTAFGKKVAGLTEYFTKLVMYKNSYHLDINDLTEMEQGDAWLVESAMNLLDKILPLDQSDTRNPLCGVDPNDASAVGIGRHWVDFIEMKARIAKSKTDNNEGANA